jgi:hypothetical protein
LLGGGFDFVPGDHIVGIGFMLGNSAVEFCTLCIRQRRLFCDLKFGVHAGNLMWSQIATTSRRRRLDVPKLDPLFRREMVPGLHGPAPTALAPSRCHLRRRSRPLTRLISGHTHAAPDLRLPVEAHPDSLAFHCGILASQLKQLFTYPGQNQSNGSATCAYSDAVQLSLASRCYDPCASVRPPQVPSTGGQGNEDQMHPVIRAAHCLPTLAALLLSTIVLITPPLALSAPLNTSAEKAARAATFEVVVPKPEKDPLTYEKPLPMELIPYAVRSDKYVPVGTAFAMGPNQFMSAAHVFSTMIGSAMGSPVLRDQQGRV